jgi:DNA-binding CsgD family transcriptional regulator
MNDDVVEKSYLRRPDLTILAARRASRKMIRAYGLPESEADDIEGEIILLIVETIGRGVWYSANVLRFASFTAMKRAWRGVYAMKSLVPCESVVDSPESHHSALWQLQKSWPSMTQRQRAALLLHLQGYEYHEVGDSMGGTYNTANQHIRAAIQKIRSVEAT